MVRFYSRLGSGLLAIVLLASVVVVLPSAGAGAVEASPSSSTASLLCGGDSLDFYTTSGAYEYGYGRVWVPSGATLQVQVTTEVDWKYWYGTWHAQLNIEPDVFELDGTYRTIWGLDPVGPSVVGGPKPPPVVTTGTLNSWTNTGASRYMIVKIISKGYLMSSYRYTASVSVSGSSFMDKDCADREVSQFFGGSNLSYKHCSCEADAAVSRPSHGDPVDAFSGNLTFPLPGFGVSGRGGGLGWALDYNSLASGVDVGVGYGWYYPFGMRLEVQGVDSMVVHQENGSTVRFWLEGSEWVSSSRATASLVENVDGSFTFTRMDREIFSFDSNGKLVGIADLFGNESTLVYAGGVLDYVEDSGGSRMDFTWSSGRVVGVSGPGLDALTPQTVSLSYNVNGDLETYTDTSGGVWSFTYDSHLMKTVRKPANQGGPVGAVVENSYDAQQRVVWQDDEADARTTFEYDTPVSGQTTVTDPVGRETVHTYVNGLRTETTVAAGTPAAATWKFSFDEETLALESVEDPGGHVTTHDYDSDSNLIETVGEGGVEFEAAYGALDLPLWTEDGKGVRTAYSWDSDDGRLLSATQNSSDPDPAKRRVTTYTYGDVTHPEDVTGVTDPEGKTWGFGYDPDTGLRTSSVDPLGNKTTFEFNDAGWLKSTVAPRGNVVGGVPADFKTTFGHDTAGRTVSVTDPEGGVGLRHYNAGLLEWEETPSGDRTEYSYDTRGLLYEVERPDSSILGYTYYPDGALKTRVDGASAATGYAYDAAGRLAVVTDPLGRETVYGYDIEGRAAWKQAEGGDCAAMPIAKCVVYSYDDSDRLEGIEYSDDEGVTTPDVSGIAYDGNGRRTAMTDGSGTSTWVWNDFGELVSTTAGNGDVVGYTYDKRGLQTSVTYPGSKTVTRVFDDAGRWTGLNDWLGGQSTFGYDANSNMTSTTFPTASGNVDEFTFDKADRISGITYSDDTVGYGSIDYGRDDSGRVASADLTGLAGADQTFTYSPLDQLAEVNSAVLGYDAADNLVTRSDGAAQRFDAANQLCWSSPSGASGTCSTPPSDAKAFEYDDSGRRVAETSSAGLVSGLAYNSADQLVAASVPTTAATPSGQFHTVTPARLLDTRNGTGTCVPSPCARMAGNTELELQVTGKAGVPASGVEAIVVTVAAVNATSGGNLRLFPSGVTRPTTTNLNYLTAETISNSATVKLGTNGKIKIYVTNAVDVVVDVQGYYTDPNGATGNVFHALDTPGRALDTRAGRSTGDCSPGVCTTLAANSTLTVDIAGRVGVPADDVSAVVVNIVAVNPTVGGYLKAYAATDPAPSVSLLNYKSADVLAQMAVVKLGSDGKIKLFSLAAVDLVVDVQGYFTKPAGFDNGSVYQPVVQTRAWDTRGGGTGAATCTTSTACDRMGGTEAITLDLTGVAGMPADGVNAVVLNLIAVSTISTGYFTAYAADGTLPAASSINFNNAQTISNSVTAGVDPDGKVTIAVSTTGSADLVVDLAGWYSNVETIEASYNYDGDGYRTTKTVDGTTETFTWDRSDPIPRLVSTKNAAGQRTYLVYGPGGTPLFEVKDDGTGLAYYHHDQLGSTIATTDAIGAVIGTYSYDPYGNPTATTGTAPILGYAGEYRDTETGYTYLRARYYDPTTGQFLTRDPLEQQTNNPYGYTNNNPTNATDPLGLWGINIGPIKVGDGCPLGTNPNGSCRGSNIKNDLATISVVAGVVAITISTGGLGTVIIAGTSLGTVGTVSAAVSAGTAIAVAYDDCQRGTAAACFVSSASAVASTVGGGLSIKGVALAGSSSTWALLGDPIRVLGDALFGGWGLGLAVPGLFGLPKSAAHC